MGNITNSEIIFEEDKPVYNPSLQRRYWLVIFILFSLNIIFLIITIASEIGVLRGKRLLIQNFNFGFRVAQALFALACIVLFLRKARWGWLLTAAIVALWLAVALCVIMFFLYRHAASAIRLKLVILVAINAALIYLMCKPLIRALYGVENALARRTILIGATVAVAIFTIEMAEPYLRLFMQAQR